MRQTLRKIIIKTVQTFCFFPKMPSTTFQLDLLKFITAMQRIYLFPTHLEGVDPSVQVGWKPPPASAGHNGRYLWTDAFGVLNFITLNRLTNWPGYLDYAKKLVLAVHETLGRTRDLKSQLPGATPSNPVSGGLRIGKEDESGANGDGQYHHYLTLWMFALNRLSIATKEKHYNDEAIALAKATHTAFVYERDHDHPRMYWKMSVDLDVPLVDNEGRLDPASGLAIFRLLEQTDGESSKILQQEILDYQKILSVEWKSFTSNDPLVLGMALWAAHWFADREEWARGLVGRAEHDCESLFEKKYFEGNRKERLAFTDFGTVLGIKCALGQKLGSKAEAVVKDWEAEGVVPVPTTVVENSSANEKLFSITAVMYAAALIPGGSYLPFLTCRLMTNVNAVFQRDFL